jgi:dienelactone hydrolase
MRPFLIFLLTGIGVASAQSPVKSVVIDGQLVESFWTQIAPGKLTPAQGGGQAETGGEIRARLSGKYLYIGARLPEPSGRFTARSIGKSPQWEEEDSLSFMIRVTNENDWKLQVGPLGAYSVRWHWTGESDWYIARPEKSTGFLVAATEGEKEWWVEAAIPLSQLGSPARGTVRITAERIRAARPGTPEERWQWPGNQPMAEVPGDPSDNAHVAEPLFQPPVIGNSDQPIEVGRRQRIPPLENDWNADSWRNVPVWNLYRNEPISRAPQFPTQMPQFPTQIKMLHNGHTLAVLARCAEPQGTVEDDSFQIYLATSGSAYVKYAINPLGNVQDANGVSGGPRIARPHPDWDSPVQGTARPNRGEWIVRLDLPLDFIATALGEAGTPRSWRILLMRSRPGRDGEPREISVFPVTQSVTPYCPARYRRLALVEKDATEVRGADATAPSGNLAFAPTRVLSAAQRKQLALSDMLGSNIRDRVLKVLHAEKRDWDRVQTVQDWENFRDPKIKALAASLGKFPARQPLATRVIKEFRGDGYRRQDLVYHAQPGVWVTANLYLPENSAGKIPGIVIAHSLHAPKTQFELQDMGILWARAGSAVLVMDLVGHGERFEGYPWSREGYHSRYITGMQLDLVGESLIKWMVWDILRGVDLLLERNDVDEKRIILLGAVAGGGDPAAVAAALDTRISAVVPFNFGESTPEIPRFIPEKNQWPLELADPGLGDWDTTRCLRRGIADQFLQWTICASVAPRRLVYAYELGWNVEDLPAWARYKKVFDLYHARDHLAEAHGFGPFPGPGECWNIGPAQRRTLYPTLERWFGIPTPFEDVKTSTSPNLARDARDRRPESELAVLTPSSAAELRMRTVHELAREMARARLERARASLARMTPKDRRDWMRTELTKKLGDIEPNREPRPAIHWSKKLPDATVEGITIQVEPGITVPMLLFKPATKEKTPVVVGLAEGGKETFLSVRSGDIERLLKSGVAVCLPDVRGTGETSPDFRRDPDGEEIMRAVDENMLGETLVGRRLKDVRTVLVYLRQRKDLDSARVALWGESLVPLNSSRIVLDELQHWQVGPQIQQQAEPLGGLLALLGALYEGNVRTIAVRGGLASYSSVLDDAFAYVPGDVIVPGLLETGDVADIAASLAPQAILFEDPVDGKNRALAELDMRSEFQPLYDAYRGAPADLVIRSGSERSNVAEFLLAHLK